MMQGEKETTDCPVYSRYLLQPNAEISGPAVIEEAESTFVVGKNATIRIDQYRNIIVEMN